MKKPTISKDNESSFLEVGRFKIRPIKDNLFKIRNTLPMTVLRSSQVSTFLGDNVLVIGESLDSNLYRSENITYAKILHLDKKHLTAKVILNMEEKTFQKRQFDIEPFEGLGLNVNDYIEIKIVTTTGERTFSYKKVKNTEELDETFKKKQYFQDLEQSKLFSPLPKDENNI